MNRLALGNASARLLLAVLVAVVALAGTAPVPARAETASPAPAIPAWTGGVDLYRDGVFATQRTWDWCTSAGVQIIRNIVHDETDQARARQARYDRYMRNHNRYAVPAGDGVDPGGWEAGLRRFVDDRYRLVASDSFASGLRSAVKSLRRTNLPVGLTVAHGSHAWILTGFTATADPLVTDDYRISTVRVTGPLWGLQSRSFGYDMRPNTELTHGQLEDFFTPWHYAPIRMAWEGQWVSIQPVGEAEPDAAASPAAAPARTSSPIPAPASTHTDVPASTPPPSASPLAATPTTPGSSPATSPTAAPDAGDRRPEPAAASLPMLAGLAVVALALAVVVGTARVFGRRSTPR